MATFQTAWKKSDGPVRYSDRITTVELGDQIKVRTLFGSRCGVITYVPGNSRVNDEMEHGCMHWVGITFEKRNLISGTFSGVLVDPDSGCTLKKLIFIKRGSKENARSFPEAPFE